MNDANKTKGYWDNFFYFLNDYIYIYFFLFILHLEASREKKKNGIRIVQYHDKSMKIN